jgi:capsular exopolysaccharide synthesis family protein
MELNKNQNPHLDSETSEFNLAKYIATYAKQWKWFVFSCIISIGLAFVYLRYTTPEYSASAKIMLVDDNNSGSPASAVLKGLNQFQDSENKQVRDEIEVLKSTTVMENVIKKLSINIQYFVQGRINETELFVNPPIKINFIAPDSIIYSSKFSFNLKVISDTKFDFIVENEDGELETKNNITFGENISTAIGDLVITPSLEGISNYIGETLFVKISPVNKLTEYYKLKISIAQIDDYSKVINISLKDPVKEKAQKIINTLIDEYNRMSIEEKNNKSKNTADFIDERIRLISQDLSNADDKIEQFKTGNRLTDITSEADIYLSSSSATDQELAENKTQLNLVKYMKDYVEDESAAFEPIPSNVGLSDPSINEMSSKYNELLRQRNTLLKSSTKLKNPIIVSLDQQLNSIKQGLKQSILNSADALNFKINNLESQSSKLNSKIYSIPGQIRQSRDIEREQTTKESLFLYLLQKREEATISLTSTSANAKVIDRAHIPLDKPVFPNKMIVYVAAFILGLCVPFGIIYVNELLDTKIHNKEDLEKQIKNIAVLGEIPDLKKNAERVIKRNDRSILSESFRIIRTNFDYVSRGRNIDKYNNVIFVTSTINGEGKSFFSLNMALTLANTDKRVLLIGGDIRNPKNYPLIEEKGQKMLSDVGLTEYLVDKSMLIGEAINTYDLNGNKIDIMLSGKIPPNPAELLMNDRMKPLFDKVSEQYDYVIVDTAPSMLVTDTLLFSQYAGHTIYMTRAGYTEKRILNFAKELNANNKLNGMMLVVNSVKQSNFGYGARYGYSSSKEKKSWFSKKT